MKALGIGWGESEPKGRYKGARTAYAAKRYQALWLRLRGAAPSQAAAAVGVTTETLRSWIKRAVAQGLDALAERKPGAGAKPKLDAEQQERVLCWVDEDPTLAPAVLRRGVVGSEDRGGQGVGAGAEARALDASTTGGSGTSCGRCRASTRGSAWCWWWTGLAGTYPGNWKCLTT